MTNNKKTITVGSIIALVILAIVIIITLVNSLTGFSIILGALFLILTICLGLYLKEDPDEYQAYVKNKKRILRTYDSIIVEVEDIPNIAGKNIIKVKSIEDLVDAQLELREPIYYKNDNDSCFFMLLHYNEACIYILRMNDSVVSPTEQSIKYMKEEPDANKDEGILENLENTIVYKLDEMRSFKISPIRREGKFEVVDDTAIKADLENNTLNITMESLDDEISKTMYIKGLKEKMKQFEEEEEAKVMEEQQAEAEKEKKLKDLSFSNTDPDDIDELISLGEQLNKATIKEEAPKKKVRRTTHSTRRASKYNAKKTK